MTSLDVALTTGEVPDILVFTSATVTQTNQIF